jgi:hypothetical protein
MRKEWVIYSMVGVALLTVMMIFSFLSHSSNSTRPDVNPKMCRMDLSVAPTLRGLRLGMSAEEFKVKYPDVEIKTRVDSEGFSSAFIDQGTKGFDSEGLSWVSLGFVDEHLSDIDFHYFNDLAYLQNPHVLIDKVTRQLGMDSRWCGGARASNCVIKCDGFEVTINTPEADITTANISISEPSVSVRDLVAQQKLQARREARDEKARQSFRP